MKKTLILLSLIIGVFISSCEQEDDTPKVSSDPLIMSVWPNSGPASTIVHIFGRNFSGIRTNNKVSFGGVEAIVIEATTSKLQVVAPEDATTGEITLSVNGVEVKGPVFTYSTKTEEYVVSTIAGDGTRGFVDGNVSIAKFQNPEGVAVDAAGNIIVADLENHAIRKITPDGEVSTIAGTGNAGFKDGPADVAEFNMPWKVAIDAAGNIIVADRNNYSIRKITPDGMVSTIAGTGSPGYVDGPGAIAQFKQPLDVAVGPEGNIIVADNTGHRIRKIAPDGTVSTVAGDGTRGFVDGKGTAAKFEYPSAVAVDSEGNIFVADRYNHAIRKITPDGTVSTLAGNDVKGFADGTGADAQFSDPYGIAVGPKGNIIVADLTNNKIRKVTPEGVVTTIAGTTKGFSNGAGSSAQFSSPTDVTVNAAGDVIVADKGNQRIRKIRLIK